MIMITFFHEILSATNLMKLTEIINTFASNVKTKKKKKHFQL